MKLLLILSVIFGFIACEESEIKTKTEPWHDTVGSDCDKPVVIVTWKAIKQIKTGMSKREISSIIGGKLNCPIESGLYSVNPKNEVLYSIQFKFNEAGSVVEAISYKPAPIEFE